MKKEVTKVVDIRNGSTVYATNYPCNQKEAKIHFDSLSKEEQLTIKTNTILLL